ncbi:hypothetical protein [Streptomyces sp. H27-D2]|uniref:hypothetical protein n=1 Tax=Streptomyces sp. H27-D2 TaxID=3046304 RepID=UPI002DBA4113|nr:hypothetical protein [Streptomyces sp. H27-D2]MEC4016976.1 hypothetical protein [Streptomyces sp. H27-D2]
MNPQEKLLELIDKFLTRQDASMRMIGEIEALLIKDFLETDVFESLAEAVSLYRPGAGMPYLDVNEMAEELLAVRATLEPQ